MQLHKHIIKISFILSILSIVLAFVSYYYLERDFISNVFIGIFTGSFLTLFTSVAGYESEKRQVLDDLYQETLKIIRKLNEYQEEWDLEKKIDFFIDLAHFDYYTWDSAFGKISFIKQEEQLYVFNNIYEPIHNILALVNKRLYNFSLHKDGPGKNDEVMKDFIDDIENTMYGFRKNVFNNNVHRLVLSRVVDNIYRELNGHYFKLLTGKDNPNYIERK